MPYKTGFIKLFLTGAFLLLPAVSAGDDRFWDFPPAPPPDQFGNVLINRTSENNDVKPVAFSHWLHRRLHTCRVCHFELEFNMKANTTEITEDANKAGYFCGSCHNGDDAFGHSEPNCTKCHNGDLSYSKDKFKELRLPRSKFGNRIDWTRSLKRAIKPENYLKISFAEELAFDKTLQLEAEWARIPPAVFPHKQHTDWLDCNNCHPSIFNIKKKATKHFSMQLNLDGNFCGVCHLNVAFPMNDCRRCHPGIKE